MGQTWAGLIEIALRSGETVRWCDGGFVRWGAALFESASAQFGVVEAIEVPEEGVGDLFAFEQAIDITGSDVAGVDQ